MAAEQTSECRGAGVAGDGAAGESGCTGQEEAYGPAGPGRSRPMATDSSNHDDLKYVRTR